MKMSPKQFLERQMKPHVEAMRLIVKDYSTIPEVTAAEIVNLTKKLDAIERQYKP